MLMDRIRNFKKNYPYIYYALVWTPISMIIAGIAIGGGHGTYFLMKLLYPYMMLSTFALDEILPSAFFISLMQYILYAVIFTFADKKSKLKLAIYIIAIIHVIAFLLCLFIQLFISKPYYF